jgi:hypothetical protein
MRIESVSDACTTALPEASFLAAGLAAGDPAYKHVTSTSRENAQIAIQ